MAKNSNLLNDLVNNFTDSKLSSLGFAEFATLHKELDSKTLAQRTEEIQLIITYVAEELKERIKANHNNLETLSKEDLLAFRDLLGDANQISGVDIDIPALRNNIDVALSNIEQKTNSNNSEQQPSVSLSEEQDNHPIANSEQSENTILMHEQWKKTISGNEETIDESIIPQLTCQNLHTILSNENTPDNIKSAIIDEANKRWEYVLKNADKINPMDKLALTASHQLIEKMENDNTSTLEAQEPVSEPVQEPVSDEVPLHTQWTQIIPVQHLHTLSQDDFEKALPTLEDMIIYSLTLQLNEFEDNDKVLSVLKEVQKRKEYVSLLPEEEQQQIHNDNVLLNSTIRYADEYVQQHSEYAEKLGITNSERDETLEAKEPVSEPVQEPVSNEVPMHERWVEYKNFAELNSLSPDDFDTKLPTLADSSLYFLVKDINQFEDENKILSVLKEVQKRKNYFNSLSEEEKKQIDNPVFLKDTINKANKYLLNHTEYAEKLGIQEIPMHERWVEFETYEKLKTLPQDDFERALPTLDCSSVNMLTKNIDELDEDKILPLLKEVQKRKDYFNSLSEEDKNKVFDNLYLRSAIHSVDIYIYDNSEYAEKLGITNSERDETLEAQDSVFEPVQEPVSDEVPLHEHWVKFVAYDELKNLPQDDFEKALPTLQCFSVYMQTKSIDTLDEDKILPLLKEVQKRKEYFNSLSEEEKKQIDGYINLEVAIENVETYIYDNPEYAEKLDIILLRGNQEEETPTDQSNNDDEEEETENNPQDLANFDKKKYIERVISSLKKIEDPKDKFDVLSSVIAKVTIDDQNRQEALEDFITQVAHDYNDNKIIFYKYSDQILWRDLLKHFNSEDNPAIEQALQTVNQAIEASKEQYGDIEKPNEETLVDNIEKLEETSPYYEEYFAKFDDYHLSALSNNKFEEWKKGNFTPNLRGCIKILNREGLTDEERAKALETARTNIDQWMEIFYDESSHSLGKSDMQNLVSELQKKYPDDARIESIANQISNYFQTRGDSEFIFPEMREASNMLNNLQIVDDITTGRIVDQEKDNSEIEKLKELAFIETRVFLANSTPAGQKISEDDFTKAYLERIQRHIIELAQADMVAKGGKKVDAETITNNLAEGKPIRINKSSIIGYFSTNSEKIKDVAENSNNDSILRRIKKFDKKCGEKYGAIYSTTKNLVESFSWGAAFGISAKITAVNPVLGSCLMAGVATASFAVSTHRLIKDYKQQKAEVIAQSNGAKSLTFREYLKKSPTNAIRFAGTLLSGATVAISAVGVAGGIATAVAQNAGAAEKISQLASSAQKIRSMAGLGIFASSTVNQVTQAFRSAKKDGKNPYWAATKAFGVSALGFVVGRAGGELGGAAVIGAIGENNNTDTPIQQNNLDNQNSNGQEQQSFDNQNFNAQEQQSFDNQNSNAEEQQSVGNQNSNAQEQQSVGNQNVSPEALNWENLSQEQQLQIHNLFNYDAREACQILGIDFQGTNALLNDYQNGDFSPEQQQALMEFAQQRIGLDGKFHDVEGYPSAAAMEAERIAWSERYYNNSNNTQVNDTSGEQTLQGEQTSGEQTSGEQTSGEQTSGEQTSGEQTLQEEQTKGNQSNSPYSGLETEYLEDVKGLGLENPKSISLNASSGTISSNGNVETHATYARFDICDNGYASTNTDGASGLVFDESGNGVFKISVNDTVREMNFDEAKNFAETVMHMDSNVDMNQLADALYDNNPKEYALQQAQLSGLSGNLTTIENDNMVVVYSDNGVSITAGGHSFSAVTDENGNITETTGMLGHNFEGINNASIQESLQTIAEKNPESAIAKAYATLNTEQNNTEQESAPKEQNITYNEKGEEVVLKDNVRVTEDGAAYKIKANVVLEKSVYGTNPQDYLADARSLLGEDAKAREYMEVKSFLANDDVYHDLKARQEAGETFSQREQNAINKFMANHERNEANISQKYGIIRGEDGEMHKSNTQQTTTIITHKYTQTSINER